MEMSYKTEIVISRIFKILTLGLFSNWLHKTQMLDFAQYRPIQRVSYKEFKDEFNKANWTYEVQWRRSLFEVGDRLVRGRCHASIIECNGKSFLLTSIGLFRSRFLIIQTILKIRKLNPQQDLFIRYEA